MQVINLMVLLRHAALPASSLLVNMSQIHVKAMVLLLALMAVRSCVHCTAGKDAHSHWQGWQKRHPAHTADRGDVHPKCCNRNEDCYEAPSMPSFDQGTASCLSFMLVLRVVQIGAFDHVGKPLSPATPCSIHFSLMPLVLCRTWRLEA